MVQKLVQKLISIEDEENSENEEGKEQLKITSRKTLANLALWYSLRTTKKPIVIILQDLECFSSQQLQDFVLLCR
jgi:Origin recognition complex (ORC) subunit 3 N-terminus